MRNLWVLTGLSLALALPLAGCETTRVPDADAVDLFVERAAACAQMAGDTSAQAAAPDLRCATVVRDGEALKLSRRDRPEDLARIEAALAPFA